MIAEWNMAFEGQLLLRILIAAACGSAIGLERNLRFKEAGVRTHCVIAIAAATLMIVSKYGFADVAAFDAFATGTRTTDPARIAAQAVSGISFLGAGIIFKSKFHVKGLTTAAGVWFTAGLGLACGSGMLAFALICTLIVLLIHILLNTLDFDNANSMERTLRLEIRNTPRAWALLREQQKRYGLHPVTIKITRLEGDRLAIVVRVKARRTIPIQDTLQFCNENPEILMVST